MKDSEGNYGVGNYGEQLIYCMEKIRCYLKIDIKCRAIYDTRKYSFYCNMKNKTPYAYIEALRYVSSWYPGCGGTYIGKTESCFLLGLNEQGAGKTEPISECGLFKESCPYYTLTSIYNENNDKISMMAYIDVMQWWN